MLKQVQHDDGEASVLLVTLNSFQGLASKQATPAPHSNQPFAGVY